MSHVERSALVKYSAQKMFDLVNNIESYPQFMPGCRAANILEKGEDWLLARLELHRGGFTQSFTTRNTLNSPLSMSMQLVEGPFKKFHGQWLFTSLANDACKVSFSLDYEFANPILGVMMKSTFETVASEQVQCLCERAQQVYSRDEKNN